MNIKHIKCPLCKHKRAKLVFSSGYNVLQCQKCQLYFHEKYFTLEELEKFYALDYCYDKGTSKSIKTPNQFAFNEEKYKDFLKRSLRKRFIQVINQFTPPLDILEIGADAGGASFYMKERGHNVEAVEICKEYAERMEAKGIKVYNTLFENIEFDKKYDIIVALEVIEHFSNPVRCIDKIYDLLKEGGYFIFETPVAKSGLVEQATYAIRLAHYCVFNPISLRKLLRKFQEIPIFEDHEKSNYVFKVKK